MTFCVRVSSTWILSKQQGNRRKRRDTTVVSLTLAIVLMRPGYRGISSSTASNTGMPIGACSDVKSFTITFPFARITGMIHTINPHFYKGGAIRIHPSLILYRTLLQQIRFSVRSPNGLALNLFTADSDLKNPYPENQEQFWAQFLAGYKPLN